MIVSVTVSNVEFVMRFCKKYFLNVAVILALMFNCTKVVAEINDSVEQQLIDNFVTKSAEGACEAGKKIFSKCLNIESSECVDWMASMMRSCVSQTGYPAFNNDGSKQGSESYEKCLNQKYIAYLNQKGIESDSTCEAIYE